LKITELFSLEALELELQDGFVKEQKHPTLPLTILNYTDKATYDRRWNDVTMHCRGLIVNNVTHEVIARGPRKFFNYGEPSAKSYPLDTKVILSRKEDGSLGIGWTYGNEADDEYFSGIATRGSFTSEQAVHATELVERESGHMGRYELHYDSLCAYADDGISYIGEIVYPENRIVLDYGGRDELIPLGTVNNRTGVIQWRPQFDHDGNPRIAHADYAHDQVITLAEAIALPIPDDEEGYVLDILDEHLETVDHLKLKGERYKELHAAIFGLSERAVWEQFVEGTQKDFIAALPDEVQPWAQEVADRLWKEHDKLWWRIRHAHNALYHVLGIGYTRKEAAIYLKANRPDVMSPVFNLLDGKEDRMAEWILKQIKPEHVPFSATKTLESVK
jgi:RNA ligase